MFLWIRHYVAEVCALPSALLGSFCYVLICSVFSLLQESRHCLLQNRCSEKGNVRNVFVFLAVCQHNQKSLHLMNNSKNVIVRGSL